MYELIFINYVVTCHTNICSNSEIPINLTAPSINPRFMCGVCSQEITDVQPVNPEEPA